MDSCEFGLGPIIHKHLNESPATKKILIIGRFAVFYGFTATRVHPQRFGFHEVSYWWIWNHLARFVQYYSEPFHLLYTS